MDSSRVATIQVPVQSSPGTDPSLQANNTGPVRTDLFIDWSRTKPLAVDDGVSVARLTGDEVRIKYPPPRRLYLDAAPTVVKDDLMDKGYEVFYTSTLRQQILREKYRLKKSDLGDARLMREHMNEFAWYRHVRTEPEIQKLTEMLNYREFEVKQGKLAAQYLASPMYKHPEFLDASARPHEAVLDLNRRLVQVCMELDLHELHSAVYGVGCLTALVALSKRPWIFEHGVGGWLHAMGCTKAARPDYPTRHSLGCDARLKSFIYGASATLIGKKSPWRSLYEEQKARLPMKLLKGKLGRGTFKVTPHKRAMNRVITRIVIELYHVGVSWAKTRGFVQSHEAISIVPTKLPMGRVVS